MRHTHFYRKILSTGQIEEVPFDASHYREEGIPVLQEMPILEAHNLVNKWNAHEQGRRFIYWL